MDINTEFIAAVRKKGDEEGLDADVRSDIVSSGSRNEPPAKSAVNAGIAQLKLKVLQDWIEAGKDLTGLNVAQEIDYWEALEILKD